MNLIYLFTSNNRKNCRTQKTNKSQPWDLMKQKKDKADFGLVFLTTYIVRLVYSNPNSLLIRVLSSSVDPATR